MEMDDYADQGSVSRIVSFRVNNDEYRKLKKISRESGTTLSSLLRKMFTQMDPHCIDRGTDKYRA